MGQLNVFVSKCGGWGLLPNNPEAINLYRRMKAVGPMGPMSGFSAKLNKLFMNVPDLSEVRSLEQLKKHGPRSRLKVLLTCHEIIHNLHWLLDEDSFLARSKKGVSHWDNEEELLTITGDVGTVELPSSIMLRCNPRLFNEHALCRILRLSMRLNHHSAPVEVSSEGTVDLSATIPKGISYADIWPEG